MTAYVGCFGLVLIAVFIGALFLRRKKIDKEVGDFYQEATLAPATIPDIVAAAINNKDSSAFQGSLTVSGTAVPYLWIKSYTSSSTMVNGIPQRSYNYFLTVVFPPASVSEDFIVKATKFKNERGSFKDWFILNTDRPIRAELLADGSFLMMWRAYDRADVYRKDLAWLQANVTVPEGVVSQEAMFVPVVPTPVEHAPVGTIPPEPLTVPVERKPYGELAEQFDAIGKWHALTVFRVLREYNRDYHDYKTHSPNGLEEYRKFLELDDEEFAIVRAAMTGKDDLWELLKSKGYPVDPARWIYMDVTVAGRQFLFVVPDNLLIDAGDPVVEYEL